MILNNAARFLYGLYINRFITNVFNSQYTKKVLISYITNPFRKKKKNHTNHFEVLSAANVFHDLGYQVDVMNYLSRPPKLDKYDVIYGFGDVFQHYFESGLTEKITIYYGTGMHVCHQNTATLNRVKSVFKKKRVWLAKSARFVKSTWSHQACLVDAIIALGNNVCKKSYEKHYDGAIYSLPAPFYQTLDATEIFIKRGKLTDTKHFLWFGSSGLVHKGLDLCIEYFATRPDLTLHICGEIYSEQDFIDVYKKELFDLPNIFVHGFISIESKEFKEILSICDFVIFPSCSEGGAPSVITAVGNGALIPIVTRETTISTGFEIIIESFDFFGIQQAIFVAESYSKQELIDLQKKNAEYVISHNNIDKYYANLKKIICEIMNNEM